MSAPRFGPAEDAAFSAWLATQEACLVLFAGRVCPYSRRFAGHFGDAGAVRELDESDAGPWEVWGIRVTPTVAFFRAGKEVARVEAVSLLGLTETRFLRWREALGESDSAPAGSNSASI